MISQPLAAAPLSRIHVGLVGAAAGLSTYLIIGGLFAAKTAWAGDYAMAAAMTLAAGLGFVLAWRSIRARQTPGAGRNIGRGMLAALVAHLLVTPVGALLMAVGGGLRPSGTTGIWDQLAGAGAWYVITIFTNLFMVGWCSFPVCAVAGYVLHLQMRRADRGP